MISQESTTKDVKLLDYDIRGHTRGTLVVGIAYGYAYYRGSAMFSHVFLRSTSEKLFIPYKASAAVQALKVCPVRPRVLSRFAQFGQESCPAGEYLHSERLWMFEKVSAALKITPTNSTHFQKSTKKKKKKLGNNFVREAEGCR